MIVEEYTQQSIDCSCFFDTEQKKIIFNKNFTQPGFQILQPFYMIETVKKRKNKNT